MGGHGLEINPIEINECNGYRLTIRRPGETHFGSEHHAADLLNVVFSQVAHEQFMLTTQRELLTRDIGNRVASR
jgi:hypothetical protein